MISNFKWLDVWNYMFSLMLYTQSCVFFRMEICITCQIMFWIFCYWDIKSWTPFLYTSLIFSRNCTLDGSVLVGNNVIIGDNVEISKSVIGCNCKIGIRYLAYFIFSCSGKHVLKLFDVVKVNILAIVKVTKRYFGVWL